ncbi:MAG: DUF2220 family protein [Bifidobacteriaceae bacterium]|jgi:hypothetical protein|nr:DUF2220 family protein [Bifidobacteriaceae bacterium]
MAAMVTPAAARERVAASYRRNAAAWAVQTALGRPVDPQSPVVDLAPPSEATALADLPAAVAWVESWRTRPDPAVEWDERRWASVGRQGVPVRLAPAGPADAARIAGHQREFSVMVKRVGAVLTKWPDQLPDAVGDGRAEHGQPASAGAGTTAGAGAAGVTPGGSTAVGTTAAGQAPPGEGAAAVVRRVARKLAELPEADFDRLRQVVAWLAGHRGSGLFARQLPVRGVDSKWVERHRLLVATVLEALTGDRDLGLAEPPGLVRLRFLDAGRRPGGIGDLAAPVAELAGLAPRPKTALVVENLQCVLALPPAAGVIAIHGSGYAVDRLADLGWLDGSRLVYWGDLDADGFNILNRLRSHFPEARSVMMDLATFDEFRDLAVPDPQARALDLPRLTASEAAACAAVTEAGLRLEQERIPWSWALRGLGLPSG